MKPITLFLAFAAVGFAREASAMDDQKDRVAHSFLELRDYVNRGDTIILTDDTGKEIKARVEALDPTQIHLYRDGAPLVLSEDVVRSIDLNRDSLTNGALIGAGIGGGLMALFLGTAWDDFDPRLTSDEVAVVGVFYVGIGTAAGVVIDALIRGRRLVYSRPAGNSGTRVSVYPIVTRERKGLGVSLSF